MGPGMTRDARPREAARAWKGASAVYTRARARAGNNLSAAPTRRVRCGGRSVICGDGLIFARLGVHPHGVMNECN